jgi:hypothetical protein
MIHSVCYTSVHQQIVRSHCSRFSLNMSLTDTLCQATYSSRCNIDTSCSTWSSLPCCSLFPLHRLSPTPLQRGTWTSVLAKSIREQSVLPIHPTPPGVRDPRCQCPGQYLLQYLPQYGLCSHMDYRSHDSNFSNLWFLKCFMFAILITFNWMTVDADDSADIHCLNSSSREVYWKQNLWHRWSFWQFECTCTIMLKEWTECCDDLFCVPNVSYGCCMLALSTRLLLCST